MIVYIESNFILDLALLQREHGSCERIVKIAEAGLISLVIPAFSVGETYEALKRKHKNRRRPIDEFFKEINELSRSQPYEDTKRTAREFAALLTGSIADEEQRLEITLRRLLAIAVVIPFDETVVVNHLDYQQTFSLSPQDAIVLASILAHLNTTPSVSKYFLERDRHFANPDIETQLVNHNCQFVPTFREGLVVIQRSLPPFP